MLVQERGFQDSLLCNPNDRGTRLIYADYLQEMNDLRWELLRINDELTHNIQIPNRLDLEKRQWELVSTGVQPIGPFRTNKLGMRFAWIPAGRFLMGSPESEEGRFRDEVQHLVEVGGFWLGIHTVTCSQWQQVMGNLAHGHLRDQDIPVTSISWHDCQEFCNRLGKIDGLKYTLPTEEQWEYACRAGTSTPFYSGTTADDLDKVGWYSDNSGSRIHPVGLKLPNAYGLFNMHGNVWEWCQSKYGTYKEGENRSDPIIDQTESIAEAVGDTLRDSVDPPSDMRMAQHTPIEESEFVEGEQSRNPTVLEEGVVSMNLESVDQHSFTTLDQRLNTPIRESESSHSESSDPTLRFGAGAGTTPPGTAGRRTAATTARRTAAASWGSESLEDERSDPTIHNVLLEEDHTGVVDGCAVQHARPQRDQTVMQEQLDSESLVQEDEQGSDYTEIYRILRGGSWLGSTFCCRSGGRSNDEPEIQDIDVGFRLALIGVG